MAEERICCCSLLLKFFFSVGVFVSTCVRVYFTSPVVAFHFFFFFFVLFLMDKWKIIHNQTMDSFRLYFFFSFYAIFLLLFLHFINNTFLFLCYPLCQHDFITLIGILLCSFFFRSFFRIFCFIFCSCRNQSRICTWHTEQISYLAFQTSTLVFLVWFK